MLACVDSHEISEWIAYERAFGPLGLGYSERALLAIYEQLSLLSRMYGEVNFEDNPAEDAPMLPAPDQLYKWMIEGDVDFGVTFKNEYDYQP